MDRCALCPGDHRCIPPDGPEDADLFFIGEKPGRDEDRDGVPFCGKIGREVNDHYLPLAGLQRHRVRVTNALKCWGGEGNKDKIDLKKQADRDRLQSCATTHLYNEILETQPKLLVPMGAFACYAIDPSINLEIQHGIPIKTKWGDCFPMYHPSGGLHEPKKMLQIRTDWDRLRKYLRGKLILPIDGYADNEDYQLVDKPRHVRSILSGAGGMPLGCDTEVKRHNRADPFCITFSVQPGTGYLIRAEDAACLSEFQDHLYKWRAPILWHNWLFDCEVVAAMGLEFPHRWIKDTMVLAYHLGNLPQGLKALAYREMGMKMQDFDDLVTPYSAPLNLTYLRQAMDMDWPKPEPSMVRDEDGMWKLYKPQGMKAQIKRLFTDYVKDNTIDIFDRWDNWEKKVEGTHRMVEEVMGQWPGKCISHAPFNKALHYACRDADSLVRLFPILEGMKRMVRRTTQENWRAA